MRIVPFVVQRTTIILGHAHAAVTLYVTDRTIHILRGSFIQVLLKHILERKVTVMIA